MPAYLTSLRISTLRIFPEIFVRNSKLPMVSFHNRKIMRFLAYTITLPVLPYDSTLYNINKTCIRHIIALLSWPFMAEIRSNLSFHTFGRHFRPMNMYCLHISLILNFDLYCSTAHVQSRPKYQLVELLCRFWFFVNH